MRITIVGINFSPEVTGIAPYTTSLARYLADHGNEVAVITSYPHYPEWSVRHKLTEAESSAVPENVSVTRLHHFVPKRPTFSKRILMEFSFAFRVLLTSWKSPEVVVAISPSLVSCAAVAVRTMFTPRSHRPRVINWVQDLYSLGARETGMTNEVGSRAIACFEAQVLKSACDVAVIHQTFRDHLVKNLSVNQRGVIVVPNWAHLAMGSEDNVAETRRAFGWAEEIVVLHAGNMGIKQGLENVVNAARLVDDMPLANIRFVLVGDGGERPKLEKLAQGVKSVTILPPVTEETFSSLLCSADVLLVNERPGIKEMAVPSKLTSYFCSGRPVVAAAEPGGLTTLEVERSGGGVAIKPGMPELLVESILALNETPSRMAEFGRAGKLYASSKLTANASLRLLENVILGNGIATGKGDSDSVDRSSTS